MAGGSIKVILGSLAGNVVIAGSKLAAALITGSGSMLAEAIHSSADCANQLLLLLGAREAAKPPDDAHPLGRGRAAYFWAFMVALMVFVGGGVFSIHEGYEKLRHPAEIDDLMIAYIVLGVAIAIEAAAAWQCVQAIQAQRGAIPFMRYLDVTKNMDIVVLFAENTAALVGLVFALIALGLAQATGNPQFDALGSIAIGVLLCSVALWLARKAKSLLQGEAADAMFEKVLREEVSGDPRFLEVLRVITLQQGPGEVMLAAKVRFEKDLDASEVVAAVNELERRVKGRCPDLKWQFIEPDLEA